MACEREFCGENYCCLGVCIPPVLKNHFMYTLGACISLSAVVSAAQLLMVV